MRKCRGCICKTCLKVCCDRKNCIGKRTECGGYATFEQLRMFKNQPTPERNSAPRKSWEDYGLGDRERRIELRTLAQSPEYAEIVRNCAHIAAPEIEGYILLAVKENRSYEAIEKLWARGEIERMPCCKTDFYGYKRLFYHLFDERVRKMTNHEKLAKITGVEDPVEIEAVKMLLSRIYEDIEKGRLEKDYETYLVVYKAQVSWLRREAK